MALMLPIPGVKKEVKFFHIPYVLKDGYVNHTGCSYSRGSSSIADMRKELHTKFELDPSAYIISKVQNNDFKRFLNLNETIEALDQEGFTLLYEIDPKLRSNIPEGADHHDSNNGVSDDYTKLAVLIKQ